MRLLVPYWTPPLVAHWRMLADLPEGTKINKIPRVDQTNKIKFNNGKNVYGKEYPRW